MKKTTSSLSCSPTSCQDQHWLSMSERAGWRRKEGRAWSEGGEDEVGSEPSKLSFCSSEGLQAMSMKRRIQDRAEMARQSRSVCCNPTLVTNGQFCSSLEYSSLVASSQSGSPSQRDVWRIHFLMPLAQGHRYGSSIPGNLL